MTEAVGPASAVGAVEPVAREREQTGPGVPARYTFDDLVGNDPEFLEALEFARRASRSDVPVLITGESGTGKEMFAQAIHNTPFRRSSPFLGINLAAMPRGLLQSELFGYEGGAFTSARSCGRAGKFEVAGRGTLLLDEIGDMPVEMQPALLRVLQERLVQRLGSSRDIPVRARIIATSHRDLESAVSTGSFRLDLFHRLRVVHLRLPPLRRRLGDVPLLVEHYLRRQTARMRRGPVKLAPEAMDALESHEWPGNVRELANLVEGEVALLPPDQDTIVRVSPTAEIGWHGRNAPPKIAGEILPIEELERRAYEQALCRYHGNVARAAEALGVCKGTMYNKIKRYRLVVSDR